MKLLAPIHTDIVLIGGGHSHVAVLKSFGMQPQPGVRLTLIAKDILTPYSGMLPGLVAGHYTHAQSHVDLQRLCRFAGARLFHSAALGIDLASSQVLCAARPPVAFDFLSIDIGSTPNLDAIPGASIHGLPVKPVDGFIQRWSEIEARAIAKDGDMDFVTVGAGAGGVELTLSIQHRLSKTLKCAQPRFHILSQNHTPLPAHAPRVQATLLRTLQERGITLHTAKAANAVHESYVECHDGDKLAADVTIITTQASAAPWLQETGLALDTAGFIEVGPTLQSTSDNRVFACGDIASFTPGALPKSGVYAVRQGPILALNLRRCAVGKAPRHYRPQQKTLALISTGDQDAIASYGKMCFRGPWVWKLKDWIDQRWMRKYQELPSMDESSTSAPASANGERGNNDVGLALQPKKVSALAMRCGGCGSKVASPIVRRVLDRLTEARGPHSDPRVLVGLQGSDDAAVLQIPAGELLVQSVDHFRTFIDDPYIFARVTTNHCLSDLFAMGATTHSAQALVSLPFADDAKIENDLTHLLAGVTEALGQANAPLVGGHTAEGPELSLGLSVNGTISPAQMLTKGAMAPGDKLVLTKGLGSGVIFAADMRALAGADVVSGALTVMLQSNQDAANTLTAHGVRACTDVTGFGLAGHLVEMLRASAMDATVSLDEVALLHGAQALFEQGLRSTLHVGNATFGDRIQRNGASDVHLATLFDPQTSGGLLASVPAAQADACVNALRAQGYAQTCIIGEVRSVPMKDLPQAGQIHLA